MKSTKAYAVAEYKLYSFKKLRISLNHDRTNKDNIRILTLTSYGLRATTIEGQNAFAPAPGAGGTLGISGWGCAAGTLGPLTYTRASSAEFCYPILE